MIHDDAYIKALCPSLRLELDPISFQFLWMVPIIEMMWADGRCQREEVRVLLRYADHFVQLVGHEALGITRERVRRFLRSFLDPAIGRSPRKQAELARLSDYIMRERLAPARGDRRKYLFDICLELAAASSDEEGQPGRRISPREERLLLRLLKALDLDR